MRIDEHIFRIRFLRLLFAAVFSGIFPFNNSPCFCSSEKAQDLIKLGISEKDSGRQRELFQKALDEDPENFVAMNNLASVFEAEKDFPKAEELYVKAIKTARKQGNDYAIAYFGLGDLYFSQERYHKAWMTYKDGLSISPGDDQAEAKMAEMRARFPSYFDSVGNFLFKDPDEIVQESDHPAFRSLKIGEDVQEAMKKGKTRDLVLQPKTQITILFDFDSDKIRDESKPQLQNLAKAIDSEAMKDYSFFIDGHTDSKGDSSYNKDLSKRRARAVKEFLKSTFGTEVGRLFERGFGEEQPLVPEEKTEDDFQKNRRVEVQVKGKIH